MKILTIFILIFLHASIYSQQDNYSTLFWNKKSLLNPASSGVNQKYYAALTGRQQWLGKTGHPFCVLAIFDTKFDVLNSGAGFNFGYENSGDIKGYNANLNYNYQIALSDHNRLSIGVSGGLLTEKLNISYIDSDPLEINDDHINIFNFKLGLYYSSKHFDLGVSSLHLKVPEDISSNSDLISIYWIFSSYWFNLSNKIDIQPNLLLKMYDTGPEDTQLHAGLLVTFNESLWTGISFSTNGNIGAMVGYDIMKKFRVGYSFDFRKSKTTNIFYGNQEIILAIILK